MIDASRGRPTYQRFLVVLLLVVTACAGLTSFAAEITAAGVLAGWRGTVSVERDGKSIAAELGMRLFPGDIVSTGPGARATVYIAGGRIEEVDAGARLVLPKSQTIQTAEERGTLRFGSSNVQVLESGLGVLNDPNGSVLLALAARGVADAPAGEQRAELLSPRNEIVDGATLTFFAHQGPRPVRIAVYDGRKLVHRSEPQSGTGPWRVDVAAALDPSRVYRWVLTQGDNDEAVSDSASFRVLPTDRAAQSAQLERSLTSLAPDAADLMRCAHYAEAGSWTAVLAASLRLLATHPEAPVAQRARDAARRALGLSDSAEAALEALLAR